MPSPLSSSQLSLFSAQRATRLQYILPSALIVQDRGGWYDVFNIRGVFWGSARDDEELQQILQYAILHTDQFELPEPDNIIIEPKRLMETYYPRTKHDKEPVLSKKESVPTDDDDFDPGF
jgi:hypothetical protein